MIVLTILIPTYNRYFRLERLLKYLISVGNPYTVRVLDSSSDPMPSGALAALLYNSSIVYTKYDSTVAPMEKLADVFGSVQTPYSVLLADDDFFVPRVLAHGVNFLEQHPAFSVVHGVSGIFSVSQGSQQKVSVSSYPQRIITDTEGALRLQDHMSRYSTTAYSIHRTKNLARNIALCHQEKFGWQFAELFLGCLDVIQGMTYTLPSLYMMREVHSGADSWNANDGRKRDFFDWVVGPDIHAYYPKFRDRLAEALQQVDNITPSAARAVVKRALWVYLSNALQAKYAQHFAVSQPLNDRRWMRNILKSIPGVLCTRNIIQLFYLNRVSLPLLLSRNSPYHHDFMPIYRVVTSSPEMI